MDESNVVSVFDGMACGMLAMMEAGVKVGRYVAFEIEKYAIKTSSHNFPEIEHRGDVFQADFTEFEGFDWLVGGSPCTYWSIAQKNNRETEASGLGWELFCQYVRALKEVKPRFFIYENNKSMSKAIRESITETFGFEPICINSALVSAQNRQRLYWVGKRNEDGSYSKVDVEQPEDRGILLKDVLDGVAIRDKGNCLCGNRGGTSIVHDLTESRHNYTAEPVNMTEAGKAQCLRATCYKDGIRNLVGNDIDRKTCVAEAVKPLTEREMEYMIRSTNGKYSDRWTYLQKPGEKDKAMRITANISKGVPYNICAEPIRVGTWPNASKNQEHDSQQYRIYSTDGKSVTQCGNGGGMGAKTGLYAVRVPEYGIPDKARPISASYAHKGSGEGSLACDAFPDNPNKQVFDYVSESVFACAIPTEWDDEGRPSKAMSGTDGKEYPVYEVKDGFITIKGKRYPIKLADGWYIIRKLTVSECKRLQTVPEWYEFPVSDTQAYKMLGNGWTVSVISHLIRACLEEVGDEG